MKRILKFAVFFVTFLLFLSGCQKINGSDQKIPTISNLKIEQITQTPTENKITNTPTEILLSNSLEKKLLSACIKPKGEFSALNFSYDLFTWKEGKYSIINTVSKERTPINFDAMGNWSSFDFSPDGQWLAYVTGDSSNTRYLVVEPSNNIINNSSQKRITWKKYSWINLAGWLDNKQLILTRKAEDHIFAPTVILDPFTGEEHNFFIEDYPEYRDLLDGSSFTPYLFTTSNLIPDPSLQRIIYPGKGGVGFLSTLNLFDLQSKKVIWNQVGYQRLLFNDPSWSLDGSDFVTWMDGFSWYQVTRNGATRHLTNLENYLTHAAYSRISRSGDGRYLVFQMDYKLEEKIKPFVENAHARYVVLDLKSEPLDGLCIDVAPDQDVDWHKPIWSPDSKYLAISNTDVHGIGDLYFLDIVNKQLVNFTKDAIALGWLVRP
jgi:hypothetical protein